MRIFVRNVKRVCHDFKNKMNIALPEFVIVLDDAAEGGHERAGQSGDVDSAGRGGRRPTNPGFQENAVVAGGHMKTYVAYDHSYVYDFKAHTDTPRIRDRLGAQVGGRIIRRGLHRRV